MTTSAVPAHTPSHPRHAQEAPLNPLRYHAMVNPVRLPEPVSLPRRRVRPAAVIVTSVTTLAIVSAAVLLGPLVGGLLAG